MNLIHTNKRSDQVKEKYLNISNDPVLFMCKKDIKRSRTKDLSPR